MCSFDFQHAGGRGCMRTDKNRRWGGSRVVRSKWRLDFPSSIGAPPAPPPSCQTSGELCVADDDYFPYEPPPPLLVLLVTTSAASSHLLLPWETEKRGRGRNGAARREATHVTKLRLPPFLHTRCPFSSPVVWEIVCAARWEKMRREGGRKKRNWLYCR